MSPALRPRRARPRAPAAAAARPAPWRPTPAPSPEADRSRRSPRSYLRVSRFPVLPTSPHSIQFMYAQDCAGLAGEAKCAQALARHRCGCARARPPPGRPSRAGLPTPLRFVTFNDGATSSATLHAASANLHRLLRMRFGSFAPRPSEELAPPADPKKRMPSL